MFSVSPRGRRVSILFRFWKGQRIPVHSTIHPVCPKRTPRRPTMPRTRLPFLLLAIFTARLGAADDGPVAHWKLAGDAKDAVNLGVTFGRKGPDGKTPAAVFDGA